MKRNLLFLLVLLLGAGRAAAATVDTVAVFSPSMKKEVSVCVITPDGASRTAPRPAIYLLHGYGGDHTTWLRIKPELPAIADRDGIVFICPDADNSWYMDSPMQPESRYETFMIEELIPSIDARYPVVASRNGRAVTGLSMGGYGAMTLAMKHKELFGAAGSTSGGLDIRPFPRNWELDRLLGEQYAHPQHWEAYTPIRMIPRLQNGDLQLIIDCGYSDFFLDGNRAFHRELLRYGIDHDFYQRPGNHDNRYWNNSIEYHILFFRNFFAQQSF